MLIRVLQPADASTYWQLRLKALRESPEAFATSYEEAIRREHAEEEVAKNLSQLENGFTLGTFDQENDLVGIVTFYRERALKLRHKGYLVGMYVSPQVRRAGVGRQLIAELIKLAREMPGLEQIHLSVVTTNEPARRLYASMGFKTYGVEPRALKFGDQYWDEEHMVLPLIQ
jgi:ribosomal protein S18 acetylase RimI-like enzyme